MAYTVTIEPASLLEPIGRASVERTASEGGSALATAPQAASGALRRLKRVAAYGPRCPDCTGPLVFGEGCQLCPVCGYSGCGGRA